MEDDELGMMSDPLDYQDIADNMLPGLISIESAWDPSAVSPVGARGLTQIMPGTARAPGYGIEPMRDWSIQEQIRMGREYLREMLEEFHGNQELALSAYNMGPGNVQKGRRNLDYERAWERAERKAGYGQPQSRKFSIQDTIAGWENEQQAPGISDSEGFSIQDTISGWDREEAPQQVEPTQPKDPAAMATAEKQRSLVESAGRHLGLSAKGLLEAPMEMTYPIYEPIRYAASKAGFNLAPLNEAVRSGLEAVGFPRAETPAEKVTEVGSSLAGAFMIPLPGEKAARAASASLSNDARRLMDYGVEMTPGAAAGGTWNSIEQKASSIPVLGEAILKRRAESKASFVNAVINDALSHIGKKVEGVTGHDAVRKAASYFDDAYTEAVPKGPMNITDEFVNGLEALKSDATRLGEDLGGRYNAIIRRALDHAGPMRLEKDGVTIEASKLKDVALEIKRQAQPYLHSAGGEHELGSHLMNAVDKIEGTLAGQFPEYAAKIKDINMGYSKFLRAQKASGMAGTRDGVFTPTKLLSAERSMSNSKWKNDIARGDALLQDITEAAQRVIGNDLPSSYTAERLMLDSILTGAGAHFLGTPFVAAEGIGNLLYRVPGLSELAARAIAEGKIGNRLRDVGGLATMMRMPNE